ncbi:acetyl-CoA carboxylase biotin carboxyl carrier protein [Candidatus Riflebacteria bacterium]
MEKNNQETNKTNENQDSGEYLDKVRQICDLMKEMPFNEMEYEEGPFRLKIVKEPEVQMGGGQPLYYPQVPLAANEPGSTGGAVKKSEEVTEDDPDLRKIVTPISRTFYEAPAPGQKPYVQLGDHIDEGQIVCIMEAMKIMNEIKAPFSGTVVKIPYKNETSIPAGSTIFLLK